MRIAMIGPFGLGPKGTMRMRALPMAQALAARGHEVVLLTEVLGGEEAEISPENLSTALQSHDFSAPLYLATSPRGHPLIHALRNRTLPWGLRQAVIVWRYLINNYHIASTWISYCKCNICLC